MMRIFKLEDCLDVSANCLVAQVERITMYLPMKILSENQTGIEIVEEGFLDCGATGKFIDQNYTAKHTLSLHDALPI